MERYRGGIEGDKDEDVASYCSRSSGGCVPSFLLRGLLVLEVEVYWYDTLSDAEPIAHCQLLVVYCLLPVALSICGTPPSATHRAASARYI